MWQGSREGVPLAESIPCKDHVEVPPRADPGNRALSWKCFACQVSGSVSCVKGFKVPAWPESEWNRGSIRL